MSDAHGSATPSLDTLEPVLDPASPEARSNRRARRVLYLATTVALTIVMALALTDALGVTQAYGVRAADARASGGGYELAVRHPAVSRPALASPFEIEVRRPGGFDGPVTIGVERSYIALWDENGLYPAPSAETAVGPWILWEFDPPPSGDLLLVYYDARIEPAAQRGRSGRVAVFEGAARLVTVDFTTRLMP